METSRNRGRKLNTEPVGQTVGEETQYFSVLFVNKLLFVLVVLFTYLLHIFSKVLLLGNKIFVFLFPQGFQVLHT